MKTLLLVGTLALTWAAPLAGQERQTSGIQMRVFQHLAQNVNALDDADFVAACAGIREGDRVADPLVGVLARASREAQSRDSIWNSMLADAEAEGDPVSWPRPRNSVEVLVPASKCSLLAEALGADLRNGSPGRIAILMIDEWTTDLDGSYEIRALIGPAPLRSFTCFGRIEPTGYSFSCPPKGFGRGR